MKNKWRNYFNFKLALVGGVKAPPGKEKMRTKQLELPEIKSIYADVYNFHQAWYLDRHDNDEKWEKVLHQSQQIFEKHKKDKFCKELLVAVMSELNLNIGKEYEEK